MKVAWGGEVVLLEARWTDKDGHTVKFQIASPNESKPNPFKQFTKRRGNRAGTRFKSGMAEINGKFEYGGEVMLAGWGDTSTQGYTVQFWVEPPSNGTGLFHPFEGFTRGKSSFMMALYELDDTTDEVIDQEQRARIEKATNTEPLRDDDKTRVVPSTSLHETPQRKQKLLSNYAAMLCLNPDFWDWINITNSTVSPVMDQESAKQWMCNQLEIDSRKEIDADPAVAHKYHELIRKPFAEYNGVEV